MKYYINLGYKSDNDMGYFNSHWSTFSAKNYYRNTFFVREDHIIVGTKPIIHIDAEYCEICQLVVI